MKHATICLIQPKGYPHSLGLMEVCDLLAESFRSLGWSASVTTNQLSSTNFNVVVGYHLLSPGDARLFNGRKVAIYQLEQITQRPDWLTPDRLAVLNAADEVWDYSPDNIEALRGAGVKCVRELPLGFHPALCRIPLADNDVDVLFYGSMNDRRAKVIYELAKRHRVKTLFGVYGSERDSWIARSKVVLNLHYYPSQIMEQVRISYLLNNGCFVISEESPSNPFGDGIVTAPYGKLVDCCRQYLGDPVGRHGVAQRGFESFKKRPMTGYLAPLVDGHK